jgi:hypothetical protein
MVVAFFMAALTPTEVSRPYEQRGRSAIRQRERLVEDKANIVCRLFSTGTMIPNDLNQPIEHGRADAGARVRQIPPHVFSIAGMTAFQSDFELPHGLLVAQFFL